MERLKGEVRRLEAQNERLMEISNSLRAERNRLPVCQGGVPLAAVAGAAAAALRPSYSVLPIPRPLWPGQVSGKLRPELQVMLPDLRALARAWLTVKPCPVLRNTCSCLCRGRGYPSSFLRSTWSSSSCWARPASQDPLSSNNQASCSSPPCCCHPTGLLQPPTLLPAAGKLRQAAEGSCLSTRKRALPPAQNPWGCWAGR